ncbi:hypothetical protein GF340_05295 [Candidatus Peregrinibacteria bacterium]|nr:hypothetical protein [Candidatus Peregrinibacteria bacterium]
MRVSIKQIIGEAWEFTQQNKKIINIYALLPAFLTTLIGIIYMIYQYFAFRASPLFENWDESFFEFLAKIGFSFIQDHQNLIIPFTITALVVGILYLLLPIFCEGAIIELVARKRNNIPVRMREGFRFGIIHFLPLFEYSLITKTYNLISMFTWGGFILRYWGWDAFMTMSPVLIVFAIASVILSIIFIYAEYFIVIDNVGVFKSMAKSSILVVTHLEETLLLFILMLIISVRIIIQIIVVLLIPAIVIMISYLLASATVPVVAIAIAGVVGLGLLYFASYINGTIHVFAVAVWVFTYLDLTNFEDTSARGEVRKVGEQLLNDED